MYNRYNSKKSRYTRNFTPWIFVFIEEFKTKKEALIREKSIKKYSKDQVRELIDSERNILTDLNDLLVE